MRRERVRKSSNSTNGITLHAGQARPFSEVDDEDEGAERRRGREGEVQKGGKTMVTEGWCATVGEDHEINMYVGGYGPRGSGVASSPRLLIGQRPP